MSQSGFQSWEVPAITTPLHPFGGKTWGDVREHASGRVRKRFPGASEHDIEDAVGSAVCDLLDYWTTAAGSIDLTSPERTFWFAVKRATWRASEQLAQHLAKASALDSIEVLQERHVELESLDDDPEQTYVDEEERATALALAAELDGEQAEWLGSYLWGDTEREAAAAAGVSNATAHRKRTQALDDLRCRAREAGVVE